MPNPPLIVEYLIITKQEDTFCDSGKSFLKFLSIDSSLDISEKDSKITMLSSKKDKQIKFMVSYLLNSDLVPSKKERYFKLTLICADNDKLNEFTDLTYLIEKNIKKLHSDVIINILWNDIGREYAIEGYALINKVENLLRRLIANFMIVNVGYHWTEEHIPNEVMNRGERIKSNNYTDYLYQTYFSDLKTILFEGQRDANFRTIGDVQKFVERRISEKKTTFSVDEIRGVIAMSLWDRYFSKATDTKKGNIENDLEELNKLRNDIAHNRHITRESLGKIKNLSNKIITALNLAINDLPNTILSPEEQRFQSATESVRLDSRSTGGRSSLKGFIARGKAVDWYKETYKITALHIDEDPETDNSLDMLITLPEGNQIGVVIKAFRLEMLTHMRNSFLQGKDFQYFIPAKINHLKECHLAIILNEEDLPVDPTVIDDIISSLRSQESKLKLILGKINASSAFEIIADRIVNSKEPGYGLSH